MRKFIVERKIPGIGSAPPEELSAVAATDNRIVSQLSPDIRWLNSFIADDKTYCLYLAKDEATIRKHAELSGIPVASIAEVPTIIDPLTANN